jgi:hypothetical protein
MRTCSTASSLHWSPALCSPIGSLEEGRCATQEDDLMIREESDQFIVLLGGRTDHMWRGLAGMRSLQRKYLLDC